MLIKLNMCNEPIEKLDGLSVGTSLFNFLEYNTTKIILFYFK